MLAPCSMRSISITTALQITGPQVTSPFQNVFCCGFDTSLLLAGHINLYRECALFCNYGLGETLLVWQTILLHPSPTSCTGSRGLLSPGQTTSSDFFAVSCFVFKEKFTLQLMWSLVFVCTLSANFEKKK